LSWQVGDKKQKNKTCTCVGTVSTYLAAAGMNTDITIRGRGDLANISFN